MGQPRILGNLNTNGVDVICSCRLAPTPYGRFGVTMDGTYVTKYEYQRAKGDVYIQNAGIYRDNGPVFRWQHTVALNYTHGPWGASFVNRFKSGYVDQDPANKVDDYSIFDLFGTWTGYKGLTLTAGIKNLFDHDPPFSINRTRSNAAMTPASPIRAAVRSWRALHTSSSRVSAGNENPPIGGFFFVDKLALTQLASTAAQDRRSRRCRRPA